MAGLPNERAQILLAEEYFASENVAFVETLRSIHQFKSLAAWADRWKKDPRPWARRQILSYLEQPLDCPGHQTVVKRLFKHAEEQRDHELMAAFLVAFDRQVRRRIETKRRWDWETRSLVEEEKLVTPRDVIPLKQERAYRNPATGEAMTAGAPMPSGARLFTYRTRYYLRRRAWRYFRFLGHRDPLAYINAIVPALLSYRDKDLARGENILDSWGLMHACFGEHPALEISATHIQLKEGHSLGELSPAPYFADAWKKPDAAPLLLSLVAEARSRLVRLWAIQLYQREHAQHSLTIEVTTRFLDHNEAEVQQFGAGLLEKSANLGTLSVTEWLKLLTTRNEEALQRICDLFGKNVSAERLDLAQCVELACARPVPIARIGQRYLQQQREISSASEREQLLPLANPRCRAVAGELAGWALSILGRQENYICDQAIRFFDSTSEETRKAAWNWLLAESPALMDPVFWSRLVETPYDDLRLRMIDFLQRDTKAADLDVNEMQHIWRSVLLGVHRGGRQKAKAVQQVAQAVIQNPTCAEMLLPVVAVAVRSIRGPESRAGLAAVMSIVEAQPQLAGVVRRILPEVKFTEASA